MSDNHQLLSGKRVLVIEDEMLVLMGIEDMLTDLGCTSITVAGNLDRALELIATKAFDLATVEVNLDGQLSYPAARALTSAGVPFTFATGYGRPGAKDECGSHPILTKPYSCHQLIGVLTALLAKGRPPALAS